MDLLRVYVLDRAMGVEVEAAPRGGEGLRLGHVLTQAWPGGESAFGSGLPGLSHSWLRGLTAFRGRGLSWMLTEAGSGVGARG